MKTKSITIGYIGVDSGALILGDASVSSNDIELGPVNEMKHIKLDETVAQGFVIPTVNGDGIFEVIGHFEDDIMVAVTIELLP